MNTGITYNDPAFVINSNSPDPYFIINPSQNIFYLGSVNDGSGIVNNADLMALYPNAIAGQIVFGLSVVYQFNGTAWYYFTGTAC